MESPRTAGDLRPDEPDHEPITIIRLRCSGGAVGDLINSRYLRVLCRHRHCRGPNGARAIHVFDTLTGKHSTEYEPID